MQVLRIAQIDINQHTVEIGLAVKKLKVGNIGLLFADQRADAPQHTGVVANRDIQGRGMDRRVLA